MCHVVKIVNLLGEFCLVYRLSNEVLEYILELVNKFAIMPVSILQIKKRKRQL